MIGDGICGSLWLLPAAQGTACIAAGLAISGLLRARPARAHQALLTTMAAAVLMPGLYLLVGHFHLGVLAPALPVEPQENVAVRVLDAVQPTDAIATEAEDNAVPSPAAEPVLAVSPEDTAARRVPWRHIAVAGWAAAAAILLGRLILRLVLGLQLLRTARPVESRQLHQAAEAAKLRLGIAGPVHLRCSDRVRSPVIWCWAREPVLLLHAGACRQQDAVEWVGVFCHEFAHLKRLDYLSGLFAETLTALVPWHPLLWWARGRLTELGEQACDDWALAAGQTGVDYAELLLDLSPQRQTAVLPGIIGKEKAMKQRIRRIIQNGCSNPTVGLRWARVVTVLAVLMAVGVAFAQRRPAERERDEPLPPRELREGPARERPAAIGRRNVLTRLREQLEDQVRETENALRERGDEAGEEGRVLRAELATLREQIGIVERQLRAPEGEPRRSAQAQPAREREMLTRRLEDLRARGQEIQRNLQEQPDMPPDRADALRQELREIREQASVAERELQGLQRGRAAAEREPAQAARPRARAATTESPEMERRRAELRAAIQQTEQEFRDLRQRGEAGQPQANELRERLAAMRQELAEIEGRPRAERARQANERRPAQAPEANQGRRPAPAVEELRNQMNEMREQMQQMQRMLQQLARQGAAEQPQPR
jgi:beta-lactamase regulating signal transducer with metallopeptidase domain